MTGRNQPDAPRVGKCSLSTDDVGASVLGCRVLGASHAEPRTQNESACVFVTSGLTVDRPMAPFAPRVFARDRMGAGGTLHGNRFRRRLGGLPRGGPRPSDASRDGAGHGKRFSGRSAGYTNMTVRAMVRSCLETLSTQRTCDGGHAISVAALRSDRHHRHGGRRVAGPRASAPPRWETPLSAADHFRSLDLTVILIGTCGDAILVLVGGPDARLVFRNSTPDLNRSGSDIHVAQSCGKT
jgi:hypothetical protein